MEEDVNKEHRVSGNSPASGISPAAALPKQDHAVSTDGSGSFEPNRSSAPIASLAGKRAAVLLYSYYPWDPRPRRAAEALASSGVEVDLLCLSETAGDQRRETVNGVNIFRLPVRRKRGGKATYFIQYTRFLHAAFWFLARHGWRRKYDVVHVHNMPDVLVFSAVIPKLRGAAIILDLHDPMPELMMSIYGMERDRLIVKLLRSLERWSILFANLVLTPNITFRNLFVSRSCPSEKIRIIMNSPRQEVFDAERVLPTVDLSDLSGEFRIMHHGSIVERHGIDLLVTAVARVRATIPGVRLDLFGAHTPFLDKVLELARSLGIGDIVHYHGAKAQEDIAQAIANCHLGVVPNRRSAFIDINFPTRLFEFLSMHRPVIGPATQGIQDYFSSEQLLMFEPNDIDDLAAKIIWVKQKPDGVRELVARGREVYLEHLWSGERSRFLDYVAGLLPVK